MKHILSKVDHTLLLQGSTWEEIKVLCDDAVKFGTASVCVAPSFVKRCAEYLCGKDVLVCTVIGFPNGYNTKEVKVFETKNAIENGADEIDMVINIGDVKMGDYDKILDEIKAIKEVFGEHAKKLNISSTKSMTGHLLGAAGAMEALVCVKSVQEDIVPPTINHEEGDEDPEIDYSLNYTFNKAQKRVVNVALSNTFGFGGHNASLIVKKYVK